MIFRDDIRQRASTLRMPTLIIWGEDDRLLPPVLGEQMHEDIAGSELVMIAAAGHVPHEEVPQKTLLVLHKFLAGKKL
jgi:pimeloyl-ACP methyl ester carboxylesterase